ncbi:MAG: hypothetical protein J1E83_07545 [Lachnospiraceae bacterium]|nr:hypothetical protein [Lachnospiraceae bacterium]
MHITFGNTPSSNVDKVTTAYQTAAKATGKAMGGYALDISGKVTDNAAYGFYESHGVHGRTAEEVMQAAGRQDISLYRNYMTVMSNSMSDEDFAKLQKEGYNPSNMDIEDTVTILDTIKAELIKAGTNVAGYTDSIDMEQLAEITGSMAYAQQLAEAFAREDIPLTPETATMAMEAFERGTELTELSEGASKYMVTNRMEPNIDNLYLAEHAGAVDANRQGRGYYAEEMPGYFAQKAAEPDTEKLRGQIEKIIEKAGYPVTEKTLQDGAWLVEKGIPLTEESFRAFEELQEVKLPAKDEDIFEAIAGALAEGKSAGEANMQDGRSIYRKAADSLERYEEQYQSILQQEPTAENIKARRLLEEIRLHMTVEANVKLLRSGFSIDTAPIEETIEALKELEAGQTGAGTGTEAVAEKPVNICREAVEKAREIPFLPAVSLGRLLSMGEPLTIDSVYETGKSIQEAFRQAGEAYETMMTAPRADLGDSIKAAFRNVDALLTNMGLELNDENRKAVRSLSYAHMELTEENLLAVKGADKTVQRVVEKMTPSAVLDMIRDGVNPLKSSMEELDSYLENRETYEEESTKYSRFLYNLEQNKEITPEEKESFIGIYRLLRQVEKSDGAAIGKLVSTQAEVSFANLLSAVRTGKVRGLDITADENFGSLREAVERGVSIDAQIERAYTRRQLTEMRQLQSGEEEIEFLKQLEEPVTIDNLLAAHDIKEDSTKAFRRLTQSGGRILKEMEREEIFSDRDSFREAYSKLTEDGEALLKEQTFAEGADSLDVRAMQLACKQLHILGVRGIKAEEYDLPQEIDGEITAVHLKLVHDSAEGGRASVEIHTARYGDLFGEFTMAESRVSGYFAGQGQEAVSILQQTASEFSLRLENAGLKAGDLRIVEGRQNRPPVSERSGNAETKELYRMTGMVIGSLKQAINRAATE